MVTVAGGVPAVEAFEDVRQVLGRDPLPGVGDAERDPGRALSGLEGDPAPGRGVAQGVGEQVAQDLAHALAVHVHGQARIGVHGQGHALGGVGLLVGLGRGMQQPADPLGAAVQFDPALLGAGDVVDVLHQPGQPGQLLAHQLTGGLVPVGHPVLQGLVVDGQHGDGGAQLVGQVREHPSTGVLGALKPCGHGVERPCQLLHLGAGAHGRYAGVVPSTGHGLGRLGQGVDRTLDPAGDMPGQCQTTDQGRGQGHAQGPEIGVPVGLLHVQHLGCIVSGPGRFQVLAEQWWAGQGGHHHRGQHAGPHHQQLGEEEPGR